MKNKQYFIQKNLHDICASVQGSIVKILINKMIYATEQTGIKSVAIAGGVSANSGFRKALKETGNDKGWKLFIPEIEYTTDNAAMIAITGYYKYLKREFASQSISPFARFNKMNWSNYKFQTNLNLL